ncbi:MAG TPA: methionyl-tRNA formyltransferase [Humibacter sp.]|nr:methionyl-tRNA formyltransferase [Humibacter sp.]
MRLVFAGTPSAAVPSLNALHASAHEIVSVITRADAPLGRRRIMTPSAVGGRADELGLPTIKTNRLDDAVTDEVADLRPDLGVVVAYGGLVRQRLLAVPRLGWINLHFSLLPRWRGAAPVQHAVLAGDETTGAAVFRLVPELDAGDVYATISRPIGASQTAGELLEQLARDGAELLVSVVDGLAAGTASAVPQSGEPTPAPKVTIEDARLRWSDPAQRVLARIRAFTPEPGAFTTVQGTRLKILEARPVSEPSATAAAAASQAHTVPQAPGEVRADGPSILIGTGTDPIELVAVQPAGKRPMPAADWWRGLAARPVVAEAGR